MPKYLTIASYTAEGTRGLLKEGGTARRAAVTKLLGALGGKVESFHYAFGEGDVYVISEAPDNVSVAAVSLAVNAAGGVSARTVVLLTPEEIDAAVKKTVDYRAPGR